MLFKQLLRIEIFLALFLIFKISQTKDCSKVLNSREPIQTYGNYCYCIKNYKWNSKLQRCIFQNPQQDKNQKQQKQKIRLAVTQQNIYWQDACVNTACPTGQIWNSSFFQCVTNCKSILNGYQVSATNFSQCSCLSGFLWNPQTSLCIRNCSDDPNSLGNYVNKTTGQCQCNTGYVWNTTELNCTAYTFSASKIIVPAAVAVGVVSAVAIIAVPITSALQTAGIIGGQVGGNLAAGANIGGVTELHGILSNGYQGVQGAKGIQDLL